MNVELYANQIGLPGGRLKPDESWIDRFISWLPETDRLLLESVQDEERVEYGEALLKRLANLTKFTALARAARDKALGNGYDKYPKKDYNCTSQDAFARRYASDAIVLREFIKDLETALKLRISLNTTAIVSARNQPQNTY